MTNQRVIFPFYHIVTDHAPNHVKHRYGIKSVQAFESDIDYLLTHFEPMDIESLLDYKNTRTKKKPGFFLSFDDGLREFYEIVAPILLRKGVPAACFLNSEFVDNKHLFYRYKSSVLVEYLKVHSTRIRSIDPNLMHGSSAEDLYQKILNIGYTEGKLIDTTASSVGLHFDDYLASEKPYMTSEQISSLISDGFYVGAHSIDHPLYATLTLDEQIRQTESSLKWVNDRFGQKIKMFAFPFSDYGVGSRFFAHFKDKLDISFGTAGIKNESYSNHFQRIPMEVPDATAEVIIKSEYSYYALKSLFGKNTIHRHD